MIIRSVAIAKIVLQNKLDAEGPIYKTFRKVIMDVEKNIDFNFCKQS